MQTTKNKLVHWFIIFSFVALYLLVSIISTIHVIDFFELSNASGLAITLAIAFEVGAAASLASLIVLDKMNKTIVWGLFVILTFMQMMGNTYFAFSHLNNYQGWVELFGLTEMEPIAQKRILAIVSGAILPVVALGFIKALVDYIKPSSVNELQQERGNSIVNDSDNKSDEILSDDTDIKFQKDYQLINNGGTPKIDKLPEIEKPVEKKVVEEKPIDEKPIEEKSRVIRDGNHDVTLKKLKTKQDTENALKHVNTGDPAFQKMVEEYIYKTKTKHPN